MSGINWGILQVPDIGGNAMGAFVKGREMRREVDGRNALTRIIGGGMQAPGQTPGFGSESGVTGQAIPGQQPNAMLGAAPDMSADWTALAQWKPEVALQLREKERERGEAAAKAQREKVENLARLTSGVTDDTVYQQRLATARSLGVDVSQAPTNFDPNWIQTQNTIAQVWLEDDGKKLSGLARELQDAGYQPGTPQFQEAMGIALRGKYAPQYTDDQGNVRMGQLPALPTPKTATAPSATTPPRLTAEPYDFNAYVGYVQSQGKEAADAFLMRNKTPVRVASPDQARQLPSGTLIIMPDGSEGVVP